jgi:CheY-like chemotaxis protein
VYSLPPHKPVVLCVDDDAAGLTLRGVILESSGFSAVTASNGDLALEILEKMTVEAAVLDFEMPGMNGAMLAAAIRQRLPIPIIILSGFTGHLPKSLIRSCYRVIAKGEPPAVLIDTLRTVTQSGGLLGPGRTAQDRRTPVVPQTQESTK